MEYTQEDRERLVRIEDKLDTLFEDLSEVKHDLYGNGRPGLIVELGQLRTMVEERTDPKKVAGISGTLAAVLTAIIAAAVRAAGV